MTLLGPHLAVTNWQSWSHCDGIYEVLALCVQPPVTVIFASSSIPCIGLKFPALHPNRIQRKPVSDQYGQLRPGNTEGWISLHRTETFLCFSSSPLAPQQALQNPSLACFHWKLPLAPQQTAKPPHSRWVYEFCEDFSSLNSILEFQNSFY